MGQLASDPLKDALTAIQPKLDEELEPLLTALLAGEPVEESWENVLRDVLDEA